MMDRVQLDFLDDKRGVVCFAMGICHVAGGGGGGNSSATAVMINEELGFHERHRRSSNIVEPIFYFTSFFEGSQTNPAH